MLIAIPRIWWEPTNHLNDCYFCMVDVSHYRKSKDKRSIVYPSIPSSIAPVPHCEDLLIPELPTLELPSCASISEEDTDADFCEASTSEEPHFPNQQEMDDLIQDMRLIKENTELLTSQLKEWNLLDPTCKVSKYRKFHLSFACFFTISQPHSLCYCSDIFGVFNEIGIDYNPTDWHLFVDSSVKSLKTVLLHNGNEFPSIPVGHSVNIKEEYKNIKTLLNMIKYTNHNSELCRDFLLGQQGGYTKYSCLWNSRAVDQHYSRKQWPLRGELTPGAHNVICQPLVLREKIFLPTLHIKLGLAKQFVKALKSDSEPFKHVQAMFPKLSEAKVKGGIFTRPQISKNAWFQGIRRQNDCFRKKCLAVISQCCAWFSGNK